VRDNPTLLKNVGEWKRVFARMQELLKNPNALCFLCSARTYSYCRAGVQHGRNALNNKEYGWQGRDEDEFFCVTMATE